MKKILSTVALAAAMAATLVSCGGGSSSSSSESILFGKVPGIVENYKTEREKLSSEAQNMKSEKDLASMMEKYDALESETLVKAEEAAQAWSGSTLDIAADEEFTVNTPLTVTFDGFSSKSNMTPKYTLAGEVKVAKNYISNMSKDVADYYRRNGGLQQEKVVLIGLDADGAEVVSQYIGSAQMAFIGDEVGVPAGTTVTLENLTMNSSNLENYAKIKSLKLAFAE